jgi:hypothetical protein
MSSVRIRCEAILWQYADERDGGDEFDCDETNPALDLVTRGSGRRDFPVKGRQRKDDTKFVLDNDMKRNQAMVKFR